jgi:fibronectin-binding autotransporter adhesin
MRALLIPFIVVLLTASGAITPSHGQLTPPLAPPLSSPTGGATITTTTTPTSVGGVSGGTLTLTGGGGTLFGGVITAGSGTLTLSSNLNFFNGGATVTAINTLTGLTTGTLVINQNIAANISGFTTINAGTGLTLSRVGNTTGLVGSINYVTLNNNVITGSTTGILANVDPGTLTLGGANTFTGSTTVSSGTLVLGGTTTNLLTSAVVNSGALQLNTGIFDNTGGAAITLTGTSPIFATSGSTSVTIVGGGTLTLGTTNITNGTLTLNNTAPTVLVPANSPITLPSNGTVTLSSGVLSSTSGTLTLSGTAPTFIIPNSNFLALNLSGAVTLTGGTLVPTGLLTIGSAATFTLNALNPPTTSSQIGLAVSATLTVNVTPGGSFRSLPAVSSANVAAGSIATFLGGTNTNGGTVSLMYLPAVLNLISNPLQVHVSEFDNGNHDQYVLEMSYDPTAAAALGNVLDNYLAWFDPSDGTWKNAVDGNSDGGASAQFVNGAYDPNSDFNLGWYGVDTANNEVWAVIDHNSTFGVANQDVQPDDQGLQPQGVPEPSALGLLACGLALLGRRRRS